MIRPEFINNSTTSPLNGPTTSAAGNALVRVPELLMAEQTHCVHARPCRMPKPPSERVRRGGDQGPREALEHVSVQSFRKSHPRTGLLYIESLYIVTYFVILGVALNSVLLLARPDLFLFRNYAEIAGILPDFTDHAEAEQFHASELIRLGDQQLDGEMTAAAGSGIPR